VHGLLAVAFAAVQALSMLPMSEQGMVHPWRNPFVADHLVSVASAW
jgi:hypothetical protein